MRKNLTILLFIVICLFSVLQLKAQVPNGGFENWAMDPDGNLNPVGWETTNDNPDISVEQYSPAHQGSYSMRVKTFDPGFMAVNGFAMTAFPYSLRPVQFSGWIKTTVMPGDAVYVIVSLWVGDSIIAAPGNCTFVIDSTINEYYHFTVPFTYQSSLVPDSANIMVVAGRSGNTQLGTEIIVDDLAFGFGVGMDDPGIKGDEIIGQNYPNPVSHTAVIPMKLPGTDHVTITVHDQLGNSVKSIDCGLLPAGEHAIRFTIEDLTDGVYFYTAKGSEFNSTKSFIVKK